MASQAVSAAPRFVVAQLGARMHYAVPRILHRAGLLGHLYTDICASKGWARMLRSMPASVMPGAMRKLAGRDVGDVPSAKISTFDALGLAYALKLRSARTRDEQARVNVWANASFCRKVAHAGLQDGTALYTFNGAGLELMCAARERGMRTVMEQTIAPLRLEMQLMAAERAAYPDWEGQETASGAALEELRAREEAEWEEADMILCGSAFVRDGIGAVDGPVGRCVVVPYGVDASQYGAIARERMPGQPLRVLMAGALGLRKGAPHLLATAKLVGASARFRAVGPIAITSKALKELGAHVEVMGPVPRRHMRIHYGWADMLYLPSLYEGSATVVYEALACGLPVICTPNAGSVVRDGVDGFIVAPRDCDAAARRILRLADDRAMLAEMSRQALEGAGANTESQYGARLLTALESGAS